VTFVEGDGPIPCDIAFVGEAPGHKEVQENRPFVSWAPAGKEFARYLRIPRLNRSEIYITNLFKEPIPEHPTEEELEMWGGILDAEMREVGPSTIVTLGRFATRHFLGDVNIMDIHGLAFQRYSSVPILHQKGGIKERVECEDDVVFPCIHPAAGLHSPEMQASIVADFRALKGLLEGEDVFKVEDKIEPEYFNSQGWTVGWNQVAVDTEAAKKSWVSVCNEPGIAFVVKNEEIAFGHDTFVILHGALYDYPILQKLGIAPKRFVCTQIALFLLGTEPIGLKAAAYRFCGMEMSSYAEVTREASHRLATDYFDTISEVEWDDPDPILTFERDGTSKIRQPRNLNWLIKKANKKRSGEHTVECRSRKFRGLPDGSHWKCNCGAIESKPVNLRDRWKGWDYEVKREAVEVFGDMPVATLDDVDPILATRYSARDADATRRLFDPVMERVKATRQSRVLGLDMKVIPMLCRMMEVGMKIDREHFEDVSLDLNHEMSDLAEEISDIAGYPINPGSDDQMAKLLYEELGLRVGKLTKKKRRGSVASKVLEGIKPDHRVVALALEYSECDTLESGFSLKLPKFTDSDDRIHPNIRLTATPSGRLGIAEPPLQAIPVRTERGRRIREGFIAPEGRELASWDLGEIEVRVLADYCEDERLLEILRDPKRHFHKETCANFYGIPLKEVSKDSTEYMMTKNLGFGIIYLISAEGLLVQLHQRGLLHYKLEDCQKMIDEWYKMYPGVKVWQEGTIASAKREGEVRTRYGRVRYLPGIHSPLPYVRAEAERQAVNHPIQGTASEVMKEAMVNVWEMRSTFQAMGWWECILQIHDELVCEQDKGMFDAVDPIMQGCMINAMKLKVPIRCGGVVGRNWAELK